MKNRFQIFLMLAASLAFLSCSTASKHLTTDTGTMAEGDRLKSNDFYEEARAQYTRIKTEFPQSQLQLEADLKIAETYYLEESYTAAAAAYEDFIRTYPGRPEIPKALYQLAMSYRQQMPSTPQRDTKSTAKAVDVFTRLLVEYPNSEHAKEAQTSVEEARKQLAEKIYQVGRFYERDKKFEAAAKRFQELTNQYPDVDLAEESYAREVENLRKAGKSEDANLKATRFQEKFPKSEFMSRIKP